MPDLLHQPTPSMSATVHLGANSISLLVTNTSDDGTVEEIDFLEQAAPIAHDVFSKGKLNRATVERCVNILLGFQSSLQELGAEFGVANTRVVATNILSEASNFEVLLNRIHISCGLNLELLDDGEMTRLVYLKTRRRLKDTPSIKKRNTLVLHVGPGNTRAILLKNGHISTYSSYRLGVHRTGESANIQAGSGTDINNIVRDHIQGPLDAIAAEYSPENIEDVVIIGYEIQTLAPHLKLNKSGYCSSKDLQALRDTAAQLDDDELVQFFQLDYQTAEAVVPALEINLAVVEKLAPQRIHIPKSDYEKGLLLDLNVTPSLAGEFAKEVIRSAEKIAKQFKVNLAHARQVAKLSLQIFEQLEDLHRLTPHDAFLLHIAALLHETGGFISNKAHHKHSQYIILNSEIFGLTKTDIRQIALIARYHRNSLPKANHSIYKDLNNTDRMRISKLAAILRMADALDRPHASRINEVNVRISRRRLHLHLPNITDAHAERLAMSKKGDLFENVFGLDINLVENSIS